MQYLDTAKDREWRKIEFSLKNVGLLFLVGVAFRGEVLLLGGVSSPVCLLMKEDGTILRDLSKEEEAPLIKGKGAATNYRGKVYALGEIDNWNNENKLVQVFDGRSWKPRCNENIVII